MRKNLLAFGILLLFLGLIFMSYSSMPVKPEPQKKWDTVNKNEIQEPTIDMFVEGNLTAGDTFKVTFSLGPSYSSSYMMEGASVLINITEPNGYPKQIADVAIELVNGRPAIAAPFPVSLANVTGTYNATARAIWGVTLIRIAIEKMKIEERDLEYPNGAFLPVGSATLLVGAGASFFGAKVSKRKKIRRKQHWPK